jgi:hypothetical protein
VFSEAADRPLLGIGLKRTSEKCLLIAQRQATLPVNLLLCPSSCGFCQEPVCTRTCVMWVGFKTFRPLPLQCEDKSRWPATICPDPACNALSDSADLTDQLDQANFSVLVAIDIWRNSLNGNLAMKIIVKFKRQSSWTFKRQKI